MTTTGRPPALVVLVERAAAPHADLQRFEIPRHHREVRTILWCALVARRAPVDQQVAKRRALERQRVGDGHRFETGNRLELFVDALDREPHARVHVPQPDAFVLLSGERDRFVLGEAHLERQHAFRVGAEVVVAKLEEAVDEEPRGDQQDHRDAGLPRDEHEPEPLTGGAGARSAGGIVQQHRQVGPRSLERGNDPERQRSDDDDQCREQEHGGTDRHCLEVRYVGRRRGNEHAQADPGEHDAESAAERSEHDALGQDLPDEAPAARADCTTDRDFRLARRRSSQQETRDVGARNQQDEQDRALENQQRFLCAAIEKVVQAHHAEATVRIRVRKLFREPTSHRAHFLPRLLDRRSGHEPCENGEEAGRTDHLRGIGPRGHPEIRVGLEDAPLDAGWHHSDDRRHDSVEPDRLAEDLRVALESTLPEAVADEGHGRPILDLILLSRDQSADLRLYVEHLEQARPAAYDQHVLGGRAVVLSAQDLRHRPKRPDGLEAPRILPGLVFPVRRAAAIAGKLERMSRERHETVLVLEAQGREQRRVDDAEDRRVGADAERERQSGHDGERGPASKSSEPVADVLANRCHRNAPRSRNDCIVSTSGLGS